MHVESLHTDVIMIRLATLVLERLRRSVAGSFAIVSTLGTGRPNIAQQLGPWSVELGCDEGFRHHAIAFDSCTTQEIHAQRDSGFWEGSKHAGGKRTGAC